MLKDEIESIAKSQVIPPARHPTHERSRTASKAQHAVSYTQNVKGADLQDVVPHIPPQDTQELKDVDFLLVRLKLKCLCYI